MREAKLVILALMIAATAVVLADDVRIFAVYNQTQADSIVVYNKFHRWSRNNILSEYPEYYDVSNTNVWYTSLNGKQITLCWDHCHWWTNAAGSQSVAWWADFPAETNGIAFKQIVMSKVNKDKINSYMTTNSCIRTNVASDYKVITNATIIATYGQE